MRLNTAITIQMLIAEKLGKISEDIEMFETKFQDSHRAREVVEILVSERQDLLASKADFETVTCEL